VHRVLLLFQLYLAHVMADWGVFAMGQAAPNLASSRPGLPSAGKYIGWVERALILTFVIAGFDAAIGFPLGAKTLVRSAP
jgi:hypothetical protein